MNWPSSMIKKTGTKLLTFTSLIKEKISFIPTLISIAAFGLGILLITLRNSDIEYFFFKTPLVKIHSIETLRSILTAFLTGLISITIFSFSMVMVVLNQAASHYSPKILNWMVGKRSNQYTLGIYLGTIIFTILLLIQLPKNSEFKPAYHFAIVLDAGLTFYCLTLFVSFINRVANDIQVSHITESIYRKTYRKLKSETSKNKAQFTYKTKIHSWTEYPSQESGYLQKISANNLLKIAINNDLEIKIIQRFGYYHIAGTALFCLSKEIKDKEQIESINSAFIFYPGERIQEHTFYGFRQLSEIAVKALSPGINDPGTAVTCLDYLTDLFAFKMNDDSPLVLSDKNKTPRIYIHSYTFTELFEICLIPILNYGQKDTTILAALIHSLGKLARVDTDKKHQKELNKFLNALRQKIELQKETEYFYNYLKNEISTLEEKNTNYFKSVLIQT
jgi:uncharacterized membrane protein